MSDLLAVLNTGFTVGMIFAPCVMAMMIALRLLDFPDLTIEGSFPLGGAIAAVLIRANYPIPLALLCALLAGAVAGLATSFIHERLKVSKLLSGILVLTMLYTINLRVMSGSNVSLLARETIFSFFERTDHRLADMFGWSIVNPAKNGFLLLIAVVMVITVFAVIRSRAGLRLQAVGGNRVFADRLGLNGLVYLSGALAGTNLLSSFSGAMLAMHQGFADVGMGQGVLVVSLASLAVGEKTAGLLKWKHRIPFLVCSAFLGSVIYQTLIALAIRAGLAVTDLKIATALLVLAAVAFHFYRKRDVLDRHGY